MPGLELHSSCLIITRADGRPLAPRGRAKVTPVNSVNIGHLVKNFSRTRNMKIFFGALRMPESLLSLYAFALCADGLMAKVFENAVASCCKLSKKSKKSVTCRSRLALGTIKYCRLHILPIELVTRRHDKDLIKHE